MAIDDQQPKRYEISSVLDFLKVPPGRLDDCIDEFKTYLEVKRELEAYFEIICTLAEAEGQSIRNGIARGPFVWIDDGKPGKQVAIEFTDTDDGGMKVEIRTKLEESD